MPCAVTYHGCRTDVRSSCVRSFSQAAASYTRNTLGMLIRRRVQAGQEPLFYLLIVTLDGEVNQEAMSRASATLARPRARYKPLHTWGTRHARAATLGRIPTRGRRGDRSTHDNGVVGIEVKACMTGCYHQAYQEAFIKTVRERLFFVSVYALHWLEAPEAACAYSEDAERYLAGWLCSTGNSWNQLLSGQQSSIVHAALTVRCPPLCTPREEPGRGRQEDGPLHGTLHQRRHRHLCSL
jgi:hypothetical protein